MTDAIAHRGPDGEGQFVDGPLAFGHRRLAIIDLVAGRPTSRWPRADGRYVLTYNGEIYNFRELRAELEALGHRFRSRTDTEVVLNALRRVGRRRARALQRHVRASRSGTASERELLLARDRYGIKPLY